MTATRTLTIAAIIPLYNGERFIEQAVRSVLEQTHPADECVVVDDGSTDGGPALVARLAETLPIRLLRKPNGGQSSARNHGVAQTATDLVAFLDQDDVWYPDHLATLLGPFLSGSDDRRLGWTYADLDEADESGAILTRHFLRTRAAAHPKTSVADCVKDDMFVLPSASLIARHAFEAVGGFDERLSGYEDDDLFVRILDKGYANIFLPEALSLWRIYAFSTTYSPNMVRSRMVYARKALETFGSRRDATGRSLASSAIAPRFGKALLGEYARAGRRRDNRAMDAALDDLRDVVIPHLGLPVALLARAVERALRFHGFGRLATQGRFGIARRILRLPVDYRAAALQALADRPRA